VEDYVEAIDGAQVWKDSHRFFEDEDEDEGPARKIYCGIGLKSFPAGHKESVFFEKDERCSSVIAVKCLGTR